MVGCGTSLSRQLMQPSHKQPNHLLIGCDFDGVVMYNPLRVIRPLMQFLKIKRVMKRRQLEFFMPSSSWQKWLWLLAHQSSLFPATGISELRRLTQTSWFKAELVTGRSTFLASDLYQKLKWFKLTDLFRRVHVSASDEQPHLFKERVIQERGLEYFIEDNWDIASYLSERLENVKIIWVYNIADRHIEFERKAANLGEALRLIESEQKDRP